MTDPTRTEPLPTGVAAWERAAAAVLRKSGRLAADAPDEAVWEKLTRRTLDGLSIPPLGLPGAATHRPPLGRLADAWDVRVSSTGGPDAVAALETGANSLWLTVPAGAEAAWYDEALSGVLLDLAPVVLGAADVPAARNYLDWLTALGVRAAAGGGLGLDPAGDWLRAALGTAGETTSADPADTELVATEPAAAAELAAAALAAGLTTFTVDGTAVHDAGGSDAWEVAVSLAIAVSYLRALEAVGLDSTAAFAAIDFRYAVTDEQFPSIAKLRAARVCWERIGQLSGVAGASQRQHAVTSRPMMTRYDPWVNLLRTTVAAFAAGVGGADAITVLPYDAALGEPDAAAHRWARNISALLISESHVGVVADPAGGSFAVESLTDQLAATAWAHFQSIEEAGGLPAALGLIAQAVAQTRAERAALVARRRLPITGVSEFPALGETLPERAGDASWPEVAAYAADFEALRDQPPAEPVFLATLGPIAAHTGRATFAANLLAAGGIATVSAGPTADPTELSAAYQGQRVVCLAGTDAAYAEWGRAAAEALRRAGAGWVILAGQPGESTLPAEAVDDSCALGLDALAFLHRTRAQITSQSGATR